MRLASSFSLFSFLSVFLDLHILILSWMLTSSIASLLHTFTFHPFSFFHFVLRLPYFLSDFLHGRCDRYSGDISVDEGLPPWAAEAEAESLAAVQPAIFVCARDLLHHARTPLAAAGDGVMHTVARDGAEADKGARGRRWLAWLQGRFPPGGGVLDVTRMGEVQLCDVPIVAVDFHCSPSLVSQSALVLSLV